MNLQGQAALVTGGASRLGAQTVRELAAAGAKVAIVDLNMEAGEKLAAEVGGFAVRCDIANSEQVEQAVATAREKHGPARILVNCAGIGGANRLVGKDGKPMALRDFSRIININLIGTFDVIRVAAADMVSLEPLEDG